MSRLGWGTWTTERPAELRHLQSGLLIAPILYSSKEGRSYALPPGPALKLGPRTIGGGDAAFTTEFAGTVIEWQYLFDDHSNARIQWRRVSAGEWGLRYWILLCVEHRHAKSLRYDRRTGGIFSQEEATDFRVRPDAAPSMATFHDSIEAAAEEIEEKGYFYLSSRGAEGRVAALRFNLEQAPSQGVSAQVGNVVPAGLPTPRTKPTRRDKRACISAPSPGTAQAALQAVHDVVAWNHAYDEINERDYTVLSRNWNRMKFGGFGVWLNDILFNGMMWSLFDRRNAQRNLDEATLRQTEHGNFPCLVTGNDAWPDRSQIPAAAFAVWSAHSRIGDREFLERIYPRIAHNNEWWRNRRNLADGFIGYGTSIEVGDGLYKGTKFGAQNESSMDNSPLHDDAPFNPKTGMLESIDVGLNSMFALDTEMLGRMAEELGDRDAAKIHRDRHKKLAEKISEELWDAERQVFANKLPNGEFIRQIAPTSFYPLAAGAATPHQVNSMCERYLESDDWFGGHFGLPSIARSDPAFPDNVYWRGRIWGPMNFWTYMGLRRCGMAEEASRLALRSHELFGSEWLHRRCGENYNADTGAIGDGADADDFYSWGALLPLTFVQEVLQVDPWSGLSISPCLAGEYFGPVATAFGTIEIENSANGWLVLLDGKPKVESNVAGTFSDVKFRKNSLEMTLPPGSSGQRLSFLGRTIATVEVLDSKAGTIFGICDTTITEQGDVLFGQRSLPARVALELCP